MVTILGVELVNLVNCVYHDDKSHFDEVSDVEPKGKYLVAFCQDPLNDFIYSPAASVFLRFEYSLKSKVHDNMERDEQ